MNNNQTWTTVVRFLLQAIHKISDENEIMFALIEIGQRLQKIEGDAVERGVKLQENDLRLSSIAFTLLDTILTDRSINESEEMFVNLLLFSANAQNLKPSVYSLDNFLNTKIEEARAPFFEEYLILQEFLCLSPYSAKKRSERSKNKISNILHSITGLSKKQIMKKLREADFNKMDIRIEDSKIFYNGE